NSAIKNQNGNDALVSLTTNNGSFTTMNGRDLITTPMGGAFTNIGTLAIGYDCRFSVSGDYSQNPSGRLGVEVGGAAVDASCSGSVALWGGWLDVEGAATREVSFLAHGVTPPAVLNKFKFLTAGSRVGAFANTVDMEICSSRIFDVLYGPAT